MAGYIKAARTVVAKVGYTHDPGAIALIGRHRQTNRDRLKSS